jgi:hypothetical protein
MDKQPSLFILKSDINDEEKVFFWDFLLESRFTIWTWKCQFFSCVVCQKVKKQQQQQKRFLINYLRIFGQGGFHVGATFEMRTTLCKIHLLNDNEIMYDRIFISNQKMRGESKTAGRQKERVWETVHCWK